MYLTGFADEAAVDIDSQIKVTKELGWKYIESRSIDNVNIHDLTDEQFDVVYGKLQDAGIKINCFGSTIANWGKKIDEPFESSLNEAKRAIPRMLKLGTKLIRVMSFAVLPDREPDDQMEEERFARLRVLEKMFADSGLQIVHENCMNYGGMGWPYTRKLLENIPGLKLVYDTGNPVCTLDRSKPKPYPRESSWEFYTHVKDSIAYVHIKDAVWDKASDQAKFTFPDEGDGDVRRILADLIKDGYNGGISIEPHMAVVFHEAGSGSDEKARYDNYLEYGRRTEKIIRELGGSLD